MDAAQVLPELDSVSWLKDDNGAKACPWMERCFDFTSDLCRQLFSSTHTSPGKTSHTDKHQAPFLVQIETVLTKEFRWMWRKMINCSLILWVVFFLRVSSSKLSSTCEIWNMKRSIWSLSVSRENCAELPQLLVCTLFLQSRLVPPEGCVQFCLIRYAAAVTLNPSGPQLCCKRFDETPKTPPFTWNLKHAHQLIWNCCHIRRMYCLNRVMSVNVRSRLGLCDFCKDVFFLFFVFFWLTDFVGSPQLVCFFLCWLCQKSEHCDVTP